MNRKHEQVVITSLAFVIPALVMLWIYASLGFAPWGDKTVLVSDMHSQYVEFFCALKNGDLFFSWSKVLGSGYIGVFSYYVSSPLSFLTLLVPNEYMPIGLMLLTILKIALSGLTFSIFAQKRFPDCGISALICAVCYALMSYNAAYSMCIMWLDGVIWLPVILLALERILAGRGAGALVASLTVCFFSTWYISWMAGTFCALYLCIRLATLKPDKAALRMILLRFFGSAICALGLTAWMWLPTLLSMFHGKFEGVDSPAYNGLIICNPILLAGQLLPGQYSTIEYGALPYIFCGTVTVILAIAHFSFWDPYHREKLAERAVLFLLILSMVFAPLDKIWHLFQRPNWFPFRYAFLLSFFLLYLALQALPNVLTVLRRRWSNRTAQGVALLLVVLATIEMGLNARGLINSFQERYGSTSYQAYQNYYLSNAELAAKAQTENEDSFCRIGAVEDRGLNTPLSFGYPGITHYSSFYNYDVNCLLKSLGMSQDWYWCCYRGSTPATDALLDVGYVISRTDMPGYQKIAEANGLILWKSPNTLPLAFVTKNCKSVVAGETPFERLNDLFSSLSGGNAVIFKPASVEAYADTSETVFVLNGTGQTLYAGLSIDGLQEVWVNGNYAVGLNSGETSCVYSLGTPRTGEVWTVTGRHALGWNGTLWECDLEALRTSIDAIDSAEIISVDDAGRVDIIVQAGEGQTLATTIPAEKGWTAYVDGKRVEPGIWLDAFLCLDLSEGTHSVELCYTPPGLIFGMVLGGICLAGLLLVAFLSRHRHRRMTSKTPEIK